MLHLTLFEEVSFLKKTQNKTFNSWISLKLFLSFIWLSEEFLQSPEKERSAWLHRAGVSVNGFLAICELTPKKQKRKGVLRFMLLWVLNEFYYFQRSILICGF
jgi:hypothetical protein